MSQNIYPPTARAARLTSPATVNKGGHGGSSIDQAVNNLGGIRTNKYNVPEGVAQADNTNKLPALNNPVNLVSGSTLSGPVSLYTGQIATYIITNYDSLTSYTVSCSSGKIQQIDDVITYTAPNTVGNTSITVNGKVYNIPVTAVIPATPVLAGSTIGNASNAFLVLNGSSFIMNNGMPGTHTNTDWQVSTLSDFTSLVASSMADAVNKTGWTTPALSLDTAYYVRVRYRSGTDVSEWSNVLVLVTDLVYTLSTEEALLSVNDPNSQFGQAVAISGDGTRCVVGAYASDDAGSMVPGDGIVRVFVRSGSSWTLETSFYPVLVARSGNLGWSVDIDQTGKRIVVGEPDGQDSGITHGLFHVYVRTGTTWELEYTSLNNYTHRETGMRFGWSVSMDNSGSRVVVSSPSKGYTTYSQNRGAIAVFARSGSTWYEEAFIESPNTTADRWYGFAVAISGDGAYLAVGTNSNYGGNTTPMSCVYVYKRNGAVWEYQATLNGSDVTVNMGFGGAVAIDGSGSLIVVGGNDGSSNTNAYSAYVFKRTGTTWAQQTKLFASTPGVTNNYNPHPAVSEDGSVIVVSGTSIRSDIYNKNALGNWFLAKTIQFSSGSFGGASGTKINDLTNDGSRLIIGNPLYEGSSNSGAARIFK